MGCRLPDRAEFSFPVAYLDSGAAHPFSKSAKRVLEEYAHRRTLAPGTVPFQLNGTADRVCKKLAALLNAAPDEFCLVQSTTAGEQLVLNAMDIPWGGGRVVTDALHYPGSLHLYQAMARAGMDVVWLIPDGEGRIDPGAVERALAKRTKLISLSLVSSVNGFEQDLTQVCAIAHDHGALVYADMVQAVGAVPVDIRESNVDFAACASYKWLMGDFGLGFLYVRRDLLDRVRQAQFGPAQLQWLETNFFPFDVDRLAALQVRRDTTGVFGMGTVSGAALAQLDHSLDYISRLGVKCIQDYRQPLLDRVRAELQQRGYRCVTPPESRSPILAFIYPEAAGLQPILDNAQVKVTLVDNRIRISPSVFNEADDVERLLQALPLKCLGK